MGICVGSYGREAVAKNCTILTMQKAEKYVACIELRINKKKARIVQMKSRFNHTVTEIEPIVKWVEETGVDPMCYDFQNAIDHKVSDFDQRNQDYHVENPRLIGQNTRNGRTPFENYEDNWAPDDVRDPEYADMLPF